MNIIWAETAKKDYWQNIDYLLQQWDEDVALDFIQALENTTVLLADNPKIGVKTDYKNIRKFPVVKQISLFYRVYKKTIEIVRLWNNYKDPNTLSL